MASDPVTLADNLNAAQATLLQVQMAVARWGASDHWLDRIRSLGLVYLKLGVTRAETRLDYEIQNRVLPASWPREREWETRARYTLAQGVGNCGEQACLALWFLKSKPNRPIELMSLTNEDHAFVVIGRAKDSSESDPQTWGPAAVVCDPWMNQAYPAPEFYDAGHMRLTWGSPDLEFHIEN